MKVAATGAVMWHICKHPTTSATHPELPEVQPTVPHIQKLFSCEEFDQHIPRTSGWLLDDCLAVRNAWNSTVKHEDRSLYMDASFSHPRFFHEQADERRRQGIRCQLDTAEVFDGAGSQALRFLSAWILAEEMGCAVLDSASRHTSLTDGRLYCHSTTRDPVENVLGTSPGDVTSHCTVINWFSYFNLKEAAVNEVVVDVAAMANTKTLTVSQRVLCP